MFYSKEDEKYMKKLLIETFKNPNEKYILEFENGMIVEVTSDTCYETDNGLDIHEEGYEEYNACAMRVEKVISAADNDNNFEIGRLIEISYHNYPKRIINSKGNNI